MLINSRGHGGPERPINIADRPYFQAQRNNPNHGLFVDVPRRAAGSGDVIISLSRALTTADGTFDGIVFAALPVDSIKDLLGVISLGRDGVVSLYRDDGVMLVRVPADDSLLRAPIANLPLFTTYLPNATSGNFEGKGINDGTVRRLSYRKIEGLPLVVTVGQAVNEFLSSWNRQAWVYGWIAGLLNLLIIGLGIFLAREVVRRETSENTIREREQLIRMIADNVPMLVAYVDKNLVYRFANRVAAQWMDRPVTEFPGHHVRELLPPELYDRVEPRIMAALAGTHLAFEEKRRYADGVERWADVSYVPITEGSEIGGYIVLVTDVTDRRAAEERLREREEQLRQSQKMEVVGQLTGGVAHDFNNLLGVIIGNLDLLAMNLRDRPDQAHILKRAIDAVERGGALTRQLLAFSRKQVLQPLSIDVGHLLTELGVLLQRTLGESVSVVTSAEPDLWPCRADPHQLETALLNLALNARDAMAKGGLLTISASNFVLDEVYAGHYAEVLPGSYVAIAVTDNGSGMTTETAARAAEPFFTTKEVGKGSGLGLSMVYGFCKQSGGHLRIYSEPGIGTTVTLYLPRADAAQARAAVVASVPLPASAPAPQGHGQRILVVEDNAPLREVAVVVLTSLGYSTIEAETVDQAIAVLESQDDIALLFTDIVLPGGRNGFDLGTEARVRWPHLKILFASGHPNISQAFTAPIANGAVIIPKPFRAAELGRHIKEALES